ncbi:hypothetical protein [Halorussus litoreus]|uniref:hypothetical protein n=1 Tax=Halorussus litoreus TaxID=1710536 RepID=UPI000E25B8F1|nr:hypothetical protein [Halorussus litoreus]
MTGGATHSRIVPRLDSGLTVLDRPRRRSPALHQLVLAELAEREGRTFWVDARNEASTYALYELAPSRARLSGVRVARAFTAYQHHSLVRRAVREAADPALVVAPCLPSLYRDDDVPDREAADLFESSLTILREFGRATDAPVLVTAESADSAVTSTGASTSAGADCDSDGDTFATLLGEYADGHIECTRTEAGLKYATEDFETTVYLDDGYWQTTIPYWVELFGAVAGEADDPALAAAAAGLVDASTGNRPGGENAEV